MRGLRLVVLLFAMMCLPLSTLLAQQFTRLTSTSKYACIKYPSGKFGVGKGTPTGYQPRSFSVASKEIATRLSEKRGVLREKIRKLNEFLKDHDITKTQLRIIIESHSALGVKPEIVAKVLKLQQSIDAIQGDISLINDELQALRDCQKGKTDFKSVSVAKGAAILAQNLTQIVLSALLEIDYPGSYAIGFNAFFCIRKEGQSAFRLGSAWKNPCSESSLGGVFPECPAPGGKLFMPLVVTYLASNANQSLLQSAQDDIDTQYAGNYEIKSISTNPNSPCGYLNQ